MLFRMSLERILQKMGKKSRVKAARKIENESLKVQLAAEAAQKKKTTKFIVTATVALVLVLAIVFGTVAAVTGSGVILRNTVSMYTDNIKVDNTILSYFFYNEFYNILNANSAVLSQLGYNSSLSLKAQKYSGSLTWFDYIMGHTVSNLSGYLVLASAAKAEGLTLDDEDNAQIDALIENIEKNAEELDVSFAKYIEASYGRGVKEADIRRALEIAFLFDKKNAEIVDSIKITSDDRAKFYSENKNKVDVVDYLTVTVSADSYFDEENMPADADAQIKAIADKIAAVKTADEFKAEVKKYYTDASKNTGIEYKDEDLETRVNNVERIGAANYEDDADKWAFDAARAAGDTTVIKEDGEGSYSVYMLVKPAYREEYATRNALHILLTPGNNTDDAGAKAAAEDVLAKWNAGEKTEAAFEALAKEYNEDSSDRYENLPKNATVTEFDNWLYDDARKAGDVEIVKTMYGYHVMYYVGEGLSAWEANVENTLINTKYNDIIKTYEEKFPVTVDDKKTNGVSGQNPSL